MQTENSEVIAVDMDRVIEQIEKRIRAELDLDALSELSGKKGPRPEAGRGQKRRPLMCPSPR